MAASQAIMAVAGTRKRESSGAVVKHKSTASTKTSKEVSIPAWPELLRAIQGDKGEPGAISALHQLCRVLSTQGPSAATSKKSAHDHIFEVWTGFLQHWTSDPALKDLTAAWERGDQSENTVLTVAVLQTYSTLLSVASLPSSGIIAPGSPHQKALGGLILEIINQLRHVQKYLVQQGKNDLTTAALELVNALLKIVKYAPARNATTRKVWHTLNLDAKVMVRLLGTKRKIPLITKRGRKPDIRHLMLSCLLSLLSPSSAPAMKTDILSQKGVVSAIFKQLRDDAREVVESVLETMAHLTAVERLGLELRCRIAEDSWSESIALLERDTLEAVEEESETQIYTPSATAHRYLQFVISAISRNAGDTTSLSSHQRRVLGNLVGQLGISDSELHADIALHVLSAAQDLLPGFWAKFAPSLEPRLSSRWITSMGFAGRVAGSALSADLLRTLESARSGQLSGKDMQAPNVALLLDSALMPANLGKTLLSKAIQQSQSSPLVAYLSCNLLYIGLQKCCAIVEVLEEIASLLDTHAVSAGQAYRNAAAKIRADAQERIPDLQVIIAVVQKGLGRAFSRAGSVASTAASEPNMDVDGGEPQEEDNTMILALALRTIQLYHSVLPAIFSSLRFDFGKLLTSDFFSATSKHPESAPLAALGKAALLELVSAQPDSNGEGAINWQWHKSSEGARSPLASIIDIYLSSPVPFLRSVAQASAASLLGSSLLFEHDPHEAKLWLDAIPRHSSESQSEALSFFDSCVQRCLQTPYKYVDAVHKLVESHDPSCLAANCRRASPLVATLLEQLVYRLGRKESAEPFVVYVNRLACAFAGHRECLCLSESLAAAVQTAAAGTAGQQEAKVIVAELQDLPRLIKSKSTVNTSSSADAPLLGAVDPLGPLFAYLQAKSKNDFEAYMRSLGGRDISTAVRENALSLSRLVLYGVDRTNGLRTIQLLGQLLDISEEKGRLLHLILANEGTARLFAESLGTSSATEASALVDLLSRHAQAAPASMLIVPDLYVQAVIKAPSAPPVIIDKLSAHLPTEQLLPLMELLLKSPNGSESVQSICTRLQSNLTLPTRVFVEAKWEKLVDVGSEAAISLLASCAESSLPAGILPGLSGQYQQAHRPMGWIVDAAKALIQRDIWSTPMSRVLAVAAYRDVAVYNLLSSTTWMQQDVEVIAPLILAETTIRLAVRDASASSASRCPSAITNIFLNPEDSYVRLCGSKVLLAIQAQDAAAGFAALIELDSKLPAACSAKPQIFDTLAIDTFGQLNDITNTSPDSFRVLETLVNESLRWLVRRFAEDEENTIQVVDFITALEQCLDRYSGKWLLKPHLVEPVIIAGIQNRMLDQRSLRFLASLLSQSRLQANTHTRIMQAILSDSRLRNGLAPGSSCREGIAILMEAVHRHGPHLLGQLGGLPVLLSHYTGTLIPADQAILRIFRLAELKGQTSFRQLANAWVPPHLRGLATSPFQVLAGLDSRLMHQGSVNLLRRASTPKSDAYDPLFFLPWTSILLDSDDISRSSWIALASSGALGMAVCAVSSPSKQYQLAGDRILAKARNALQGSVEFREKVELSYLLDAVRNIALPSFSLDESSPPLVAHFLSQSLQTLGTPEDFSYPLMWRYLLARPIVDATDVPLFYNLFYSAADDARKERIWLLQNLLEGVHTSEDWRIIRRRQVTELFLSFLQSGIAEDDAEMRLAILKLLTHVTLLPAAVQDLVGKSGLFACLASLSPASEEEAHEVVRIVDNCVSSVQTTKLRRARDGLWLVEALRAMAVTWKRLPSESLTIACHAVRRCSLHLARSTKAEVVDIVAPMLTEAFERALDSSSSHAPGSREGQEDIKDLFDGVLRLDYTSQGKVSGELLQRATELALQAGIAGVKEDVIRAWHTV